jgi:hypothetical protein
MLTFFSIDCQSLFLRHTETGKCIAVSNELVYNNPSHALPYFVVMIDNCLNGSAQFRYLDTELLHNIEKSGTLVAPYPRDSRYKTRWAVYKGVAQGGIDYQQRDIHRLKQTAAGYLYLHSMGAYAEPSKTSQYLLRRTSTSPNTRQKFTFGKRNICERNCAISAKTGLNWPILQAGYSFLN